MQRKPRGRREALDDPNLPKYSIAAAADISGVPQQQLRRMEDSGLIAPHRSQGNTRRYSDNDLRQVAAISDLADDGVNHAGMRLVLDLRTEVAALRSEVDMLRSQVAELTEAHSSAGQHLTPPRSAAQAWRSPDGRGQTDDVSSNQE